MSYPSSLETLLEQGRVSVRGMIKFQFGGGTYGIWNGRGDLIHGGVTYVPNSLIGVEDIAFGMGTEARAVRITMPESADFGVTPDLLASIEAEDYKGRKVTIYDAYIDPDTTDLLHVEALYAGYIDTIDHEIDGGEMRLVAHVQTKAIDNHRDGYRSASNADQQLISAGDLFFEHAAKVGFETFDVTLD